MKKITLWALAALSLFSCSKEEIATDSNSGNNQQSSVLIKINIDQNSGYLRSIEDQVTGDMNKHVVPRVYSVSVIPYNEYGVEMTQIDLNEAAITSAIIGSFKYVGSDNVEKTITGTATNVTGAMIALPVGAKYVDVVLNKPTGTNPHGISNINYFNYRQEDLENGKLGNSDEQLSNGFKTAATNNFDRVYLTTEQYGVGQLLKDATTTNNIPTYKLSFNVSPSLARLEVIGGINVKDAEEWKDAFECKWGKILKTDFDAKYILNASDLTIDKLGLCKVSQLKDGQPQANLSICYVTTTGEYLQYKTITGVAQWVTFMNARTDKENNIGEGAEKYVYLPEKYWYVTGSSEGPTAKPDASNTKTEKEVDDNPAIGAAWVINALFTDLTTNHIAIAKWYPNAYFALDIESIFINNIKVKDSQVSTLPYSVSWPGSEEATGWGDWYKSYHTGGWHYPGTAANNTFMCMGNMWDWIAKGTDPNLDQELIFTSIGSSTLGTSDRMTIIKSKASTIRDKGTYYNTSNSQYPKNIGIETGKSSAYHIYPQATTATNKDGVASAMPHVILKVKAYKTAEDFENGKYVKGKEFLTIRAFKNGSNYVTNYQRAYIYKMDLAKLLDNFIGSAPVPVPSNYIPNKPGDPLDPDPEMPGAQLEMNITVTPWTIENITPEV